MGSAFHGAVFDVDGVLVDSPHERAWREALRELFEGEWSELRDATAYTPERFGPLVYQRVVAGKPRLPGARAALEHFEVPGAENRAEAYAERKQRRIVELIEAGEFEAFPDALRFLLAVKQAGIRVATASSSRNAPTLLRRIRLEDLAERQAPREARRDLEPGPRLIDLIDADLSGRELARGKPDPEIFLGAAEALDLAPGECFVVEDAPAGIEAAVAGGMDALAVARAGDSELLLAAGAGLVVTSLDQVDLDALSEGRLVQLPGRG